MKEFNSSFLKNLSKQDHLLVDKIVDWTNIASDKYTKKFSFFLDCRQSKIAKQVLDSLKFDNYKFFGGYDDAQRLVLGVFPPYCEAVINDFPVKGITFTYRKCDILTHRDVLGSLMSLKVTRECIGDIIINEGKTIVFVVDKILPLILENVHKIGKIGVKTEIGFDLSDVALEQKFSDICGTVASLRADSVVALAINKSREKASSIIKTNGVVIDYEEVFSPSYEMCEGICFSIRGYGKFLLSSVDGLSRKNRLHITIKKYD